MTFNDYIQLFYLQKGKSKKWAILIVMFLGVEQLKIIKN